MPIPSADAVFSRLGRRGAALDLIEEIEDETVESLDAADLLSAEPPLLLQKLENRLVRHHLAKPDVEGDNPPVAEPKTRAKSVASPMSAVMAAIHLPTSRFARWRNRRLT